MGAQTLRFGILGAARIAPNALIKPARVVKGVEIFAIAARDKERAVAFASQHQIPRVLESYEALVNDPDIDAVYVALPNSLHAEWTIKALQAGKHVLCEKPMASNGEEALKMALAADASGQVLMEAFHYRYHPMAARIQEICASGEIGLVREIEADFFIPLFFRPKDIRFQYPLAGGAVMDTGCYCLDFIRWLGGGEPQVLSARARLSSLDVDRLMRASLSFDNGIIAKMACSLAAFPPIRIFAQIRGTHGTLSVSNPFSPHSYHKLHVSGSSGNRQETVTKEPTYNFQLRAFLGEVGGPRVNLTNGWEGVKNMRLIDAIYTKAGLKIRGGQK